MDKGGYAVGRRRTFEPGRADERQFPVASLVTGKASSETQR